MDLESIYIYISFIIVGVLKVYSHNWRLRMPSSPLHSDAMGVTRIAKFCPPPSLSVPWPLKDGEAHVLDCCSCQTVLDCLSEEERGTRDPRPSDPSSETPSDQTLIKYSVDHLWEYIFRVGSHMSDPLRVTRIHVDFILQTRSRSDTCETSNWFYLTG